MAVEGNSKEGVHVDSKHGVEIDKNATMMTSISSLEKIEGTSIKLIKTLMLT